MSQSCSSDGPHSCECAVQPSLYGQLLTEMDFERGIWSAAADNELKRVKNFLDKGCDCNVKDNSGYTALHYASRNGHYEVCKLLLATGADPNIGTKAGHVTPLHRAAYCGHVAVVELLLQWKADPSLCDSDGQNALHKACAKGNIEVAKILVSISKTLSCKKDNKGKKPVDYVSPDNRQLHDVVSS